MSNIGPKPEQIGDHSNAHRILDERVLRGIGLMRGKGGIRIEWLDEQYVISASPAPGGASAPAFDPTELDPTVATTKGSWRYLSPNNALVVTGFMDTVAGVLVQSPPGLWIAKQYVPAKTTTFNVPQYPYPGATGTPTGSPLKGDIDGANVYWLLISTPVCV